CRFDWKSRLLLITWFGAFRLFYSCYEHYGDWWYTRFLLPGIPAIILGALVTARDASDFFQRFAAWRNRTQLRLVTGCLLLFIVLCYEQQGITRFAVLEVGAGHLLHPASCQWSDR